MWLSRDAADVVLHVGYDGWWQQDKEVIPMTKLSAEEVSSWQIVGKGSALCFLLACGFICEWNRPEPGWSR
jgi:hypothetical protein